MDWTAGSNTTTANSAMVSHEIIEMVKNLRLRAVAINALVLREEPPVRKDDDAIQSIILLPLLHRLAVLGQAPLLALTPTV